ncbi:MAG: hypothetical protein ACFB12_07415 [Leptolyngbyaceae cyanobacterium]
MADDFQLRRSQPLFTEPLLPRPPAADNGAATHAEFTRALA